MERMAETVHLPKVADPEDRFNIGELVAATIATPGWEFIREALAAKVDGLRRELTDKPVRSDAAEYERTIGEMRGLEGVPAIVAGLIKRGEESMQDG
jgi:hypothetical protein